MYKAGRYAEISDYASANQTGCAAGVIITDSLLMTGDYRTGLSLIGANTPLPGRYIQRDIHQAAVLPYL